MHRQKQKSADSRQNEMQSVFVTQMERLLLPARLLTGSVELAAECYLEAWENCMDAPFIAPGYAFQAAKREVVKSAITRIASDIASFTPASTSHNSAAIPDGHGVSLEGGASSVDSAKFRRAFVRLNAFYRAVLLLRRYEKFSSVDTALQLGISRQTLKSGLERASTALLRELVKVELEEPAPMRKASALPPAWQHDTTRISTREESICLVPRFL